MATKRGRTVGRNESCKRIWETIFSTATFTMIKRKMLDNPDSEPRDLKIQAPPKLPRMPNLSWCTARPTQPHSCPVPPPSSRLEPVVDREHGTELEGFKKVSVITQKWCPIRILVHQDHSKMFKWWFRNTNDNTNRCWIGGHLTCFHDGWQLLGCLRFFSWGFWCPKGWVHSARLIFDALILRWYPSGTLVSDDLHFT